jgi:hypothetical protein
MKTHRFNSSVVGAFVCILFLLACSQAGAVNWRITQITDNDGLDMYPKVISQGWVAWTYRLPPAKEEIMLYYPGLTPIRQITDNDFTDTNPDLSWDTAGAKPTLCWQTLCGPDNTSEIFTLGPKAPLRLTDNAYDDKEPKNWGTHIVWEGQHNNADWEIFHYTPSLGVVQLTKDTLDDYNPAVFGSRILWSKADPEGDYGQETYYFDGIDTVRLTENAWMESDHRIDGTHLVWGMFHGSGAAGNWEIHHKRGNGPVEQLTDNDLPDLDPSVSGDRIAWMRYDGNDNEIMYYDGTTVRQLTNNGVDDKFPQISGQRVVWVQYPSTASSYDGQIFVFDDTDDSITLLEDGYDDGYAPQIAGDFVVWHVWDGHDYEIMMAIACDNLPGDVNKDCVVDLADFAALAADWLNCTLPAAYCP